MTTDDARPAISTGFEDSLPGGSSQIFVAWFLVPAPTVVGAERHTILRVNVHRSHGRESFSLAEVAPEQGAKLLRAHFPCAVCAAHGLNAQGAHAALGNDPEWRLYIDGR